MTIISRTYVAALGIILSLSSSGSPLFPGITVTSSANGNFLVTPSFTLGRDLGGGASEIEKETFHVQQRIGIKNERDAFRTAAVFWSEAWSFDIDRNSNPSAMSNNFALVTNDGETVIVVSIQPAMSSTMEVFSIYRRSGVTASPARTVHLNEVWTRQELESIPNKAVFTDSSPQWFAGGALNFSPDNRQLIHKTRGGNTVVINLKPK